MSLPRALPPNDVRPASVALKGGVVINTTPSFAPPGSAIIAKNYEPAVGGGFQRSGAMERFDGRPRPSDAVYTLIEGTFTGVAVGNTVNGQTSSATGVVATVGTGYISVTKKTGTFTAGEVIRIGVSPIGTSLSTPVLQVTADISAQLTADAAAQYRADIAAVPGSGPIRGLAVLNDVVYAWRNNAGGTAMEIYKSTTGGWSLVALNEQVSFSNANTSVGEGDTLTQGAVTATILRVVVETGTLLSGTNTGKLVISNRAGGSFSGAAATSTGGGALTLGGAQTAIVLDDSGVVESIVTGFTGLAGAQRIYGCDGVNPEFEFDGTVYVPLNTGMSTKRAKYCIAHKNHLFFSYDGSLQHSSIGDPYSYTPITGAAELGTGDFITGLAAMPGSEAAAALFVSCLNSAWVLYGNNAGTGNSGWNFIKVADRSGGKDRSVVTLGDVVSFDASGALKWRPTDTYGNFTWDSMSDAIKPVVENAVPIASVSVRQLGRARWFTGDGGIVTAAPGPKGSLEWSYGDLGRVVWRAVNEEISGVSRTFYGCSDGFVYEADVGRSDDGSEIESVLRLNPWDQKSPYLLKKYVWADIECQSDSPFSMSVGGELSDQDPDIPPTLSEGVSQSGQGSLWDLSLWDEALWDTRRSARTRIPLRGKGYNVSLIFYQKSGIYESHTIKAATVGLIPLRTTNWRGA